MKFRDEDEDEELLPSVTFINVAPVYDKRHRIQSRDLISERFK